MKLQPHWHKGGYFVARHARGIEWQNSHGMSKDDAIEKANLNALATGKKYSVHDDLGTCILVCLGRQ
jgi:hypothetical protein